MKQLRRSNFNFTQETAEALSILSIIEERTMTSIVEDALQAYISQHADQIDRIRKTKQEIQALQKGTKQNDSD